MVKCFVSNCHSGTPLCSEKRSFFMPPASEERLAKWREAVGPDESGRELTRMDRICDRHFEPRYIRRTLYKTPFPAQRPPGLMSDAVPSIFEPSQSTLLSGTKSAVKQFDANAKGRGEVDSSRDQVGCAEKGAEEKYENANSITQRATVEVVASKKAADGRMRAQDESAAKNLFNHLFEVAKRLSLPGNSWAVHCIDKNGVRDMIFSQLVVKHAPQMATVYSPRTVLVRRNMTVNVLLMGVTAKSVADVSTEVSSVADLEKLLRAVDALRVCKGGPNSKVYPKAEPECAYLDSLSAWRHNHCPLVLTEPGDTCRMCHSLSDTLRVNMNRAIARQNAAIPLKAIRVPRMFREDVLQLRKANCALRRSNRRLERRIEMVSRELKELRQEIEVVRYQTQEQNS